MSYERKNGDVSIFKNGFKKATNQPDYKGTVYKDGQEFEIALWVKDGKKGKFFAGKLADAPFSKKETTETIPNEIYNSQGDSLPF